MHAYQNFLEQTSKAPSINEAAWRAMCETQVKDLVILTAIFPVLVNKVIVGRPFAFVLFPMVPM